MEWFLGRVYQNYHSNVIKTYGKRSMQGNPGNRYYGLTNSTTHFLPTGIILCGYDNCCNTFWTDLRVMFGRRFRFFVFLFFVFVFLTKGSNGLWAGLTLWFSVLLFYLEHVFICNIYNPCDPWTQDMNVHKTFRKRSGHLLIVLCTFNLCPVFGG